MVIVETIIVIVGDHPPQWQQNSHNTYIHCGGHRHHHLSIYPPIWSADLP